MLDLRAAWLRFAPLFLLLFAGHALADSPPPWSTGQSRPEDLIISLVTFGPGDDVPSYFGHIGLVVEDRRLNVGRLYNYGMFNFDQTMLLKFTRGRLEFWVGEDDPMWTLRLYKALNRDITIQVLNLLPDARLMLAQALATNVLPENRNYLYNHYFDNCATRPRDLIDRAVGGQLIRSTSVPGRMTLREHTLRYGAVDPLINLAMDFGLNDQVDQPPLQSQEAFLPDEVERQLETLKYVNSQGEQVPYVSQTIPYYRSNRRPVPAQAPRYALPLLALGFLLGLIPLLFTLAGRRLPRAGRVGLGVSSAGLGFLMGFLGLLLAFLWLCTNHLVAHHNENLFLTSPLALAAVPLGVSVARGKRPAALRHLGWLWSGLLGLALAGALLKLSPRFDQRNGPFFALWVPVLVGLAVSAILSRLWQSRGRSA